MSIESTKFDKKKIFLTEQAVDKLKTFSRFNGVKTRVLVDAMLDIVLDDEALSKRIIELTLEREASLKRQSEAQE